MRNPFIYLILITMMLAASCNSPERKDAAKTRQPLVDSTSMALADFVRETHLGFACTMALGEVAGKSNNLEIRDFGTRASAQSKALLDSIKAIADDHEVPLYDSADILAEQLAEKVSAKTGIDFERSLMRAFSSEQRRISSAFRKGRKANDAVKKFVRNNMPVWKSQNEELHRLKETMKSTDREEKERDQSPA